MAEQTIIPGGKIEAATPDEVGDIIARMMGGLSREESPIQAEARGQTDAVAGGQLSTPLVIYTVPAGMRAVVTRLYVADDAHTFQHPFAATDDFGIEVLRNDVTVDGQTWKVTGGANLPALPWTINQGRSQGIILTNGDTLSVRFGGNIGPGTSLGVVARMQGWLTALAQFSEGERYKPRNGGK